MRHEEIARLLSSYLDDELTEEERAVVHEHLESCEACSRRLRQLTVLTRNVRSAGNLDLPYAFAHSVLNSIHHEEEEAVSWTGLEHYAQRFVLGLALLILVLLGVTTYKQNNDLLPVERYVSGVSSDSSVSQILLKQGALTKEDVMFAVFTK